MTVSQDILKYWPQVPADLVDKLVQYIADEMLAMKLRAYNILLDDARERALTNGDEDVAEWLDYIREHPSAQPDPKTIEAIDDIFKDADIQWEN